MSDILILGYYGFQNSGDDALLLSIIQQLKKYKEDINLCVLSKNPAETSKIYNVKAVKRDNPVSLLKALISCKMLLVGGGTLIQDGTSTKSLLYYLYVIRTAQLMGKKIMLYANGIGPLKKENRSFAASVLNKVDIITLRDKNSYDELVEMGVVKPEIKLLADSAFGLDYNKNCDITNYLRKYNIPENYFCVSVRDTIKTKKNFCEDLANICDYLYEKYNCYPVFLPFQRSRDMEITDKIRSLMKAPSSVFYTECNIEVLLKFMSGSALCIGMRLHSLIYSAICGVPLVGIVYDPKVRGFMEYMGQKRYIDAQNMNYEELNAMCDECFEKSEDIRKELSRNFYEMKKKSEKNAEIAVKLLNN